MSVPRVRRIGAESFRIPSVPLCAASHGTDPVIVSACMSPSGAAQRHVASMCRDACSGRKIPLLLPPKGARRMQPVSPPWAPWGVGGSRRGSYGYLPPHIPGATAPELPPCQSEGVRADSLPLPPHRATDLMHACDNVLASSSRVSTAAAAVSCSRYPLTSISFMGKIRTDDVKLLQCMQAQGIMSRTRA